ncbi:FkbM family methyltransferase [Lentibacter algarum]|uniref:FkbM family methyltransferase n=1 Tax=Lentibacter algarum TaxID=576131 RepID=UPI001C06C2E4|nr:FkbM family methyltransferase [Lentibacter algarum]MBU2980658.1 FkbM family methyltransferase [Lentibacter algarum]
MSTTLINRYGVPIKGIVHVGANRGQEIDEYFRETDNVMFVEPIPELVAEVRKKIEEVGAPFTCLQECCSDTVGEIVDFNVSNGTGDNSSLLPLGDLLKYYPDIAFDKTIRLKTTTVDALVGTDSNAQKYNCLAVDTQGADLKVLHGAKNFLEKHVDFVYVEAAIEPIYKGGATLEQIDAYMKSLGFGLKNLDINIMDWGNALYARNTFLFESETNQCIQAGCEATQSSTLQNKEINSANQALTNSFRQGNGARTGVEDQPWWQIDLGTVQNVSHAFWLDRRLRRRPPHPIDVKISDDGETWTTICTLETEEKRTSTSLIKRIDINAKTRFIRLQAQGRHSMSISQFYAFA